MCCRITFSFLVGMYIMLLEFEVVDPREGIHNIRVKPQLLRTDETSMNMRDRSGIFVNRKRRLALRNAGMDIFVGWMCLKATCQSVRVVLSGEIEDLRGVTRQDTKWR